MNRAANTPLPGTMQPLCVLAACLTAALCSAQTPTFAGDGPAGWAQRLVADREPSIAALAAGRTQSLAVLRELLAHDDGEIVQSAARACQGIGPAAAPLRDVLLAQLQHAARWSTQASCCRALATIGTAEPAALDTMVGHVCESTVPALRQACARALGTLTPQATQRLLAAVDHGRATGPSRVVDALVAIGEPCIAPLLEALPGKRPAAAVAREALAQIGWRAVTPLERAGHAELAQLALATGPLRHVRGSEHFVVEHTGTQPAIDRMPTLTWESGSGHGGNLSLFRAAEDAEGVRIDQIRTLHPRSAPQHAPTVEVLEATIPRARAREVVRQLAALGRMTLREKQPQPRRSWHGSGNFHARVRVAAGDRVLLDAAFTGYPGSSTTSQRFRAEAAVAVLREALAEVEWTPRAATGLDRDLVATRRQDGPADTWWVEERLQTIATGLR